MKIRLLARRSIQQQLVADYLVPRYINNIRDEFPIDMYLANYSRDWEAYTIVISRHVVRGKLSGYLGDYVLPIFAIDNGDFGARLKERW